MGGSICMSGSGLILVIASSFLAPLWSSYANLLMWTHLFFQLGRGKLKDLGTSHLSRLDSHCESNVDVVSLVLRLDVGLLEQGAQKH